MTYGQKKQQIIKDFLAIKQAKGSIGLGKTTSTLFRDRPKTLVKKLDVRHLNQVIKIDKKALIVEAEGMITFENLVSATLKYGLLPLVVPELKTITLGGGISGLAIESSSFKYGLVHESVLEMDILLAGGEVVTARPDNKYQDLFYAIPNSYGTLGYVLRVVAKLRPAKPFVHIRHLAFDDPEDFFAQLEKLANSKRYKNQPLDFIDGTVFSLNEMYLTLGRDADSAEYASDYTFKKIYYKSIKERSEDYLSTHDYIWRWDTDWFWCSRLLLMENPLIRRLLGKKRLNSRTYFKILHFGRRSKIIRFIGKLRQSQPLRESVIQDIEVPIDKASEFLSWFSKNIGITPVWVCPTRSTQKRWPYPLYPMNADKLYINFGFWDTVPAKKGWADGYYNKLIEKKVQALGGTKSLYSTSFYDQKTFEKIYNFSVYKKLKQKYDSKNFFKDLYQKAVQK